MSGKKTNVPKRANEHEQTIIAKQAISRKKPHARASQACKENHSLKASQR